MFDVTLLIFEYDEPDVLFAPPNPDIEIPERERERLDNEMMRLIDSGAFDPANELIEPA